MRMLLVSMPLEITIVFQFLFNVRSFKLSHEVSEWPFLPRFYAALSRTFAFHPPFWHRVYSTVCFFTQMVNNHHRNMISMMPHFSRNRTPTSRNVATRQQDIVLEECVRQNMSQICHFGCVIYSSSSQCSLHDNRATTSAILFPSTVPRVLCECPLTRLVKCRVSMGCQVQVTCSNCFFVHRHCHHHLPSSYCFL